MESVRYLVAVLRGSGELLYVCPSDAYGHYWDVSADPFRAFRAATLDSARKAMADLKSVFGHEELAVVRMVASLEVIV